MEYSLKYLFFGILLFSGGLANLYDQKYCSDNDCSSSIFSLVSGGILREEISLERNYAVSYYDYPVWRTVQNIPYGTVKYEGYGEASPIFFSKEFDYTGSTYEEILPYHIEASCYSESSGLVTTACSEENPYLHSATVYSVIDIPDDNQILYLNVITGTSGFPYKLSLNNTQCVGCHDIVDDFTDRISYTVTGATSGRLSGGETLTDYDWNMTLSGMQMTCLYNEWNGQNVGTYINEACYAMNLFGLASCTSVSINDGGHYSTSDPVAISISGGGCDLMGLGAGTGSVDILAFPESLYVTTYSGASGTPAAPIFMNFYQSIGSPAAGGHNTDVYLSPTVTAGATATYYNRDAINYTLNRSLYVSGYVGTSGSLSRYDAEIGFAMQDLTYWNNTNGVYVEDDTAADPHITRMQVLSPGTIDSMYYWDYWIMNAKNEHGTDWTSPHALVVAYAAGINYQSGTVSYYSLEGLCTTTTPNYCRNAIDNGLNYPYLDCSNDGTSIGYYDTCDVWHSCVSYCKTGGNTCYDYWSTNNTMYCQGVCLGVELDAYCNSTDGNVWGYDSCDGGTNLLESCLGAGCSGGKCYEVSTGYLKTQIQDVVNDNYLTGYLNATVTTEYGYSYNTTIYTRSLGSVITDLPAGIVSLQPHVTGYNSDISDCIGYSGTTVYHDTVNNMCIVKILPNAPADVSIMLYNSSYGSNYTTLNIYVIDETKRDIGIMGANVSITVNATLSYNAITTPNGLASFAFNAGDDEILLEISRSGYDAYSETIPIKMNKFNEYTAILTPETYLTIEVSGSDTKVLYNVLGQEDIQFFVYADYPGTISVSREDVIVRPCSGDWNDVLCEKYALLKLKAPNLPVIGAYEKDGYVLGFVNEVTAGALDLILPVETVKNLVNGGKCSLESTTEKIESIDGYEMPLGTYKFYSCEMDGTIYYIPFFTEDIDTDNFISTFVNTSKSYPLVTLGVGGLLIPLIELVNFKGSDLYVDYVIFSLDENLYVESVLNPDTVTAYIQGEPLKGTPADIMSTASYRPLIRRGTDPLILDNGFLSYLAQPTQSAYERRSKGINSGLEAATFSQYVGSKRATEGKLNPFPMKRQDLIGDIITDIENDYVSVYEKEIINTKLTQQFRLKDRKYKIETYLKVCLAPDNVIYPTTCTYVKTVDFYDKGVSSVQLLGLLVVGFILFLLLAPFLMEMYKNPPPNTGSGN